MGWVRMFVLLVIASVLTDIVAWHQITIPLAAYTVPFWTVCRLSVIGISLCWIVRIRCWIAPSAQKKIHDLARDETYNEIYDIAQRAAHH